jgi:hypothetical protein
VHARASFTALRRAASTTPRHERADRPGARPAAGPEVLENYTRETCNASASTRPRDALDERRKSRILENEGDGSDGDQNRLDGAIVGARERPDNRGATLELRRPTLWAQRRRDPIKRLGRDLPVLGLRRAQPMEPMSTDTALLVVVR